jgi:EAL domain-containing protein (putative c-di-GMP-specific phosphodiesterase class I)
MGLSTCLDDFGTGYSSLAYLLHLPIHVVKIDLSFLRNIPGDTKAESVVKMIRQLGESLGLCVIAEGVEQEPQAAFLREIGCELAQGYYFGRPVPASEAGKFLEQGVLR